MRNRCSHSSNRVLGRDIWRMQLSILRVKDYCFTLQNSYHPDFHMLSLQVSHCFDMYGPHLPTVSITLAVFFQPLELLATAVAHASNHEWVVSCQYRWKKIRGMSNLTPVCKQTNNSSGRGVGSSGNWTTKKLKVDCQSWFDYCWIDKIRQHCAVGPQFRKLFAILWKL